MLAPGDAIGDWVVEEMLGEGGMGAVFRAHNKLVPDILAAVKVMKPISLDEARERFLREVRAVHKLQHPHIVRITGFGEDKDRGLLWMAMDLIEGEELGERIGPEPMPCADAMRIFEGLVDALSHAHGLGVFHRDLKPSNVLLDADGVARLVDFGIAAQQGLTRLTRTGTVIGTPAYLPPETFDAASVDPARADVYAAGQILHELLTGEVAFPEDPTLSDGQRLGRLVAAKARAAALDPGGGVPPDVRALVRDATAPDPEDRIPTALALLDRLARLGPETRWVRMAPPPEAVQGLDSDRIHEDTWGGGEPTWDSIGDPTEESPKPPPPPNTPRSAPQPASRETGERRGRGAGVAMAVAAAIAVIAGLCVAVLVAAGVGIALWMQADGTPPDPVLAAVETDAPNQVVAPDPNALVDFDRSALRQTPSGLGLLDLAAGSGPSPSPGDTAVVHYRGWLEDGQMFDSSHERSEPFRFQLGRGSVIKAWDEGIDSMQVGGRRILVAPPGLAYGSRGVGGTIPPDATLIFEVELVDVEAAPAAPPSDEEMMHTARSLVSEVRELSSHGKAAAAQARCQAFERTYAAWIRSPAGERYWSRMGRTCDELAIIGTPAPRIEVEKWYQGGAPPPSTPVLIVFWETWCPHCRREVPKLEGLQQRFQGRLSVVAVTKLTKTSTDEAVREFIAEHRLSYAVGKERGGSLSSALSVRGIPAAALLKDGRIAWRGHPAVLDDEAVEALLR